MLSNFPQIVKYLLAFLPQDDYPKLDTFSFVSCWLSFVLDQSQTGMRCNSSLKFKKVAKHTDRSNQIRVELKT